MTNHTTSARTALTLADLVAGYDNDLWHGWGYLNARSGQAAEYVAFADAIVLDVANAQRWTADELFAWCDSKLGRWFGDEVFGAVSTDRVADVTARAIAHGLFDITQIH